MAERVARTLLAENDRDAIVALVGKLVADNADMARGLAQVKRTLTTTGKVGRAQLQLVVMSQPRAENRVRDRGP